jgi:hypothetical protein
MSGDYTRFTFKPSKNFSGVRKQQGRVDLDADWNEEGDIQDRRWRAETMDIVGRCYVSRETPDAFEIVAAGNNFTIDLGRIYVDGLLAENHGYPIQKMLHSKSPLEFDSVLAEERGPILPSYKKQLYLPKTQPLAKGNYLVYLDVWQREVTYIEEPALLEKALGGVDTTTRLQTVWQVKVLELKDEEAQCDSEIDAWDRLVAPPAGRLKVSADAPSASEDPCVISPSGGYRGLENRLYRVEIHDAGHLPGIDKSIPSGISVIPDLANPRVVTTKTPLPNLASLSGKLVEVFGKQGNINVSLGKAKIVEISADGKMRLNKDLIFYPEYEAFEIRKVATFKWSRDNGSVVVPVKEISYNELTVESLGRDKVLSFNVGDWVEVLDDHRELHNEPGEIALITKIDEASRKITLNRPIPAGGSRAFAAASEDRHTRVQRWDQKQGVDSDGLLSVSNGLIEIEDGIKVLFDIDTKSPGEAFRTGDYWVFAARTADGSVEPLEKAPPRGIHHHYCKLAVIKVGSEGTVNDVNDCRPKAPDSPVQKGTCCTVTVGDGEISHGDYPDIQTAIDAATDVSSTNKGYYVRVCILPGRYDVTNTININGDRMIVSGCGLQTIIKGHNRPIPLFNIKGDTISLESMWLIDKIQQDNKDNKHALVELQGSDIQVENNVLNGGGIWIRSGSKDISIRNNKIIHGEGPGILLGNSQIDSSAAAGSLLSNVTFFKKFQDTVTGFESYKVVSEAELNVAEPEELVVLSAPDTVWRVQIRDNTIEQMIGSGITTVYGVHLSNMNSDVLKLGEVKELVIEGNRIEDCVKGQPDFIFPDATRCGGGIMLTNATDVSIKDNYIARNGQHIKAYEACGIMAGNCTKMELCGNTIINNGLRDGPTDDNKYFQAGVALLYVKGEEFAARIHNNIINCPAGQALIVLGMGHISVVGNNLTSNEFKQQSNLIEIKPNDENGIKPVIDILTKCSCVLVLDWAPASLGNMTMVKHNVISMSSTRIPELEASRGLVGSSKIALIASVGILSFENILISDNQFVMSLKAEAAKSNVAYNVVSGSWGIQACGNYFREVWQNASGKTIDNIVSYYFDATVANIVTSNMATYGSVVKTCVVNSVKNECVDNNITDIVTTIK